VYFFFNNKYALRYDAEPLIFFQIQPYSFTVKITLSLQRLLFILSVVLCSHAGAQNLWTPAQENALPTGGKRYIVPQKYLSFHLNTATMSNLLAAAPDRFGADGAENQVVMEIPMPDGTTAHFRMSEASVMAPALQNKYPQIRCYTGYGVEDPFATIKCDITPQGFHAMVRKDRENTVFIDPYMQGNDAYYVVYYKKDYRASKANSDFACDTEREDLQEIKVYENAAEFQGDCQLRRYRLALACTGEYATFHGGTVPLVMGAMTTAINRVNSVYENEIGVTLQMVPNNDTLIFLNPASDPYTNNSGSTMLGQNVTTCNARIGLANYDIGHVFSTGGGGIAGLGVVCTTGKARGVTGQAQPIGDPFVIDYVVHEMGHQFDADHTQNNNCNRVAGASMEPGSASTIMGYAGICSPNVQSNSDDYFHAISLQQIGTFLTTGAANNCPVFVPTTNSAPTVSGGADYTIPKSTPFFLTATGSDANGDNLTYCWEQMDPEFATMPPAATSTTGPMFRTFKGTASPTRFFPRLTDLVNNVNPTWEKLPSVARTLKFRVTVRDNHAGNGCTEEDDVVVTVANVGPFVVTEPNTNVLWYVNDQKTVTWNVNGTDGAPVNCSTVNILLSTDGGFTYPYTLASGVANTGQALVMVPNQVSNTCRVRVQAAGNIFFDISNTNFRIQTPPMPDFTLETTVVGGRVCAGNSFSFGVTLDTLSGFNSAVALSVLGAPAGATVSIQPNSVTPPASATITLSNLNSGGVYPLSVLGVSGALNHQQIVELVVVSGIPAAVTGQIPADGSMGIAPNQILQWNAVNEADTYLVEVATNPAFQPADIVYSLTVDTTIAQTPGFQYGTVYYWRVRASNLCGDGPWSAAAAFQSSGQTCDFNFVSSDVPLAITDLDAVTVVSSLNVPENKTISDLNVSLKINHSYVGDLSAKLLTPWGTEIALFDRPGVPEDDFGCGNENMDLTLDDAATLTYADLELTCDPSGIAIAGAYQPLVALSAANGQNAPGLWRLSVNDAVADDGGALVAWSLSFCFPGEINAGALLQNNPLVVGAAQSGAINNALLALSLSGTAAQGQYVLWALPQHGTLTLSGNLLGIGSTFTQADIDGGLLQYQHDGDNATADAFYFDALDQNNQAWLHNQQFQIQIVQNNLTVSAAQTAPVTCPGSATGQITATAAGLDGQYQYSINGGTVQTSNVFNNLAAGAYTVVVTGQFGFTASSNVVVVADGAGISGSASVTDDDVTLSASGGSGSYTYSVNGVDFQNDNVFSDLPNGAYTFTIKDANGCTTTIMAIVAVNTLIATASITDDVLCAGENTGVIEVMVGGGTAPITYSIDGVNFQDSPVFTGLASGAYTVTVKDASGFEATTPTLTLASPAALNLTASANLNTITANGNGGTGALTYSINGVNFQSSGSFGSLANGVYTVTVKDDNGCTKSVTTEVNVPVLTLTAAANGTILCFGDNTGSITASANGGIPPYEYRLGNGAYQTDNTFSNLTAGVYTVTVKDGAGTETSNTITIGQPGLLEVSVSLINDDAAISISGGTTPYTYTLNGIENAPLNDLEAGDYSVVVTDANGCTTEQSFIVLNNSIVIEASLLPPTCAGGNDGSAILCINGGYGLLQVVVEPASGTFTPIDGPCVLNASLSGLSAGVYQVIVSDSAGFIRTLSVDIPDAPAITVSAEVSLDTITLGVSGGTPGYQYSVDGQNYQASPVFPGLDLGAYTGYVKDANGCVGTLGNIQVLASSANDVLAAWGLSISPNPGNGLFRLSWAQAPAQVQLRVRDAAGRLVSDQIWNTPAGHFQGWLHLEEMPQGLYFLHLSDGQRAAALRLSIVR
jgi:subtilisin-like proprotein convertase family protein